MTAKPGIYNVYQVAERWQVEHQVVRRMVRDGRLPAFRVGNNIRITEAAIAEYEGWNWNSDGSEADGTHTGETETPSASASVPQIVALPNSGSRTSKTKSTGQRT